MPPQVVNLDIVERWLRADDIRKEFYEEKAKADSLAEEAIRMCNTLLINTKNSLLTKPRNK